MKVNGEEWRTILCFILGVVTEPRETGLSVNPAYIYNRLQKDDHSVENAEIAHIGDQTFDCPGCSCRRC